MSKFSKIFLIFLILITALFINDKFGNKIGEMWSDITNIKAPEISSNPPVDVDIIDPPDIIPSKDATEVVVPENKNEKEKAVIYFLALDKNNNTVYKKTQKTISQGEDKLTFAIKTLLKGPDLIEKSTGVYSEIPANVKLHKIKYTKDKVIIDLSSDFQYGGGTDSIYSRMMQLIKTAVANTEYKKIYLYTDGKQVNTIGGEGIMITQPLTEKSLDF